MKAVFKRGGDREGPSSFVIEVAEGDLVFEEGDLGTEMYIIQDGAMEIIKTIDGRETRLSRLEKGDFFGEMSVLEGLPRTAGARAITASRLLQINGSTFDQMLRSQPEIAVRMMRKLSRRLRETDAMLEQALGKKAPARALEAPAAASPSPAPSGHVAQRLVDVKSGAEFPLAVSGDTSIGRRDPVTGIHPHVDLTDLDDQRSTSRQHARIYRTGGKLYVTEEIGTTNGTFVNGTRLATGTPAELAAGDDLQFGLVRMKLHLDG